MHKIPAAYALAAVAHNGQKRIGKQPYINHPIRVAERVSRYTHDPEVIIAATLHDVLEDSNFTEGDVEGFFGARVAELVVSCSDSPEIAALPRAERKAAQAQKYRAERFEVRLIKACDQVDNIKDLYDHFDKTPRGFRETYPAAAMEVFRACAEAGLPQDLLDEAEFIYGKLQGKLLPMGKETPEIG